MARMQLGGVHDERLGRRVVRLLLGDPRLLLLLGEQPGQRPLGPQPLEAADQRVQVERADDQQRVHDGAEDRLGRRADRQYRGERIVQLAPHGLSQLPGPLHRGENGNAARPVGHRARPGRQLLGEGRLRLLLPLQALPYARGIQRVPRHPRPGVRGAGHRHAERGTRAGQQGRRRAHVDGRVPQPGQRRIAALATVLALAARLADRDQQAGQRGPGPGQRLRPAPDRAGRRHRPQQPPHVGESLRGEHVRAPRHRGVRVGQRDGHVPAEQPGPHRLVVTGPGPYDGDHAALGAQFVHDVPERAPGADDLVGETGEVGQRRVLHHHHAQSRAPRRVQHVLGPRVGARVRRPQGARMQDDGGRHLQLPQPFGVAYEHAGTRQRGAQYGVEGGGPVARGLGRAGQYGLGGLGHVVLDQQGRHRARHTAGGGVGGVVLRRGALQRRTQGGVGGQADPVRGAQLVVHDLEGRRPGHRLRQLADAQRPVEHQGGVALAGAVDGRVGGGHCHLHAVGAEAFAQPGAEGGVLAQQRRHGRHQAGRGRQPQARAGHGGGDAQHVGPEGRGGDPHGGRIAGVGQFLHRIARAPLVHPGQSVLFGQFDGPVHHPVGECFLGRGHHQPGETGVPVGEHHVRVLGQCRRHPSRHAFRAARPAHLLRRGRA